MQGQPTEKEFIPHTQLLFQYIDKINTLIYAERSNLVFLKKSENGFVKESEIKSSDDIISFHYIEENFIAIVGKSNKKIELFKNGQAIAE